MVRNGPPPASEQSKPPASEQRKQHWVPGHIWLTDVDTDRPVLVSLPGVAQARLSECGSHWIPAGMGGWHVTVKETPDQIAALIQTEWYDRISGEAIMGAEFGSGEYVADKLKGGTGR
ncbi:hypothetical protein LBMAG46_42290 [Planctomycetia bacterium]|nr:hypothetical protein LBMAG46_42290 [Planctomycetia bacterium]